MIWGKSFILIFKNSFNNFIPHLVCTGRVCLSATNSFEFLYNSSTTFTREFFLCQLHLFSKKANATTSWIKTSEWQSLMRQIKWLCICTIVSMEHLKSSAVTEQDIQFIQCGGFKPRKLRALTSFGQHRLNLHPPVSTTQRVPRILVPAYKVHHWTVRDGTQ